MARNRTIGVDGDLPWTIPEDTRFFRTITSGHILIMGRKTFETFPSLLPNRFHIIVTRQENYTPAKSIVGDSDQFLVVSSTDEAIEAAQALIDAEPDWGDEVFNIGGGEIYAALLDETDRIYLTEIDVEAEGDAHFPRWHEGDFNEVERRAGTTSGTTTAAGEIPAFEFVVYHRAGR